MDENWKVLSSLFPQGWKQIAQRGGAVERLRGFRSSEVLLRWPVELAFKRLKTIAPQFNRGSLAFITDHFLVFLLGFSFGGTATFRIWTGRSAIESFPSRGTMFR
jgi:hypothetical protein